MSPSVPRHIPVLGHQAVALLTPRDGGIYVDATFGAGGYSRMILDIPGTRVIGIDRDRTERVLRLHAEIREQRDAIATLRSEWAKLDAPLRLQGLAERHLPLKPLTATQYDSLKNLPERPPNFARSGTPDPIGAMIDTIEAKAVTGSVPAPEDQQ